MAWGLDIAADSIRVCWARRRRGVRAGRRVELPAPPGLIRPSLKESNLGGPAALGRLVADVCRRAGCRGWIRVALPDPVFSLRVVVTDELPPDREDARRFLKWQARDMLPFPLEEIRLDFVSPIRGQDGRLRVPCLMARERILREYEDALAAASLQIAALDAHSLCVAHAVPQRFDGGLAALLSVSGPHTTLLMLREGRPCFWRTLAAGAGEWEGEGRERLFREVIDSVAFYREAEGTGPVHELFLDGWGEPGDEITMALGEWLELPAGAVRFQAQAGDGIHWAAAIGAATRSC